ncbi:hypothetical protein MMB17_15825 [Methylobacterium organophilum]|uniref:hypothetical protein n=1 Tax=Methylobacterium organophilum TaxID=410 RepID=UPI001F12D065|nr:hypothetical protein [Methylobacterium organophilum]UMY16183.1 hypothetical protein MMB17_15825 [Methylobacterium organophilum]
MPALLLPAGPAAAQNFFEELFGIGRAARPPVPRQNVPPPAPPAPLPGEPLPPGDAPQGEARPATPAPPRQPVVLKAPSEDNVFGQELLENGLAGSLKLDRAGAGVAALVTLAGTKVSQPTESCSVKLNSGKPLALAAAGKPEGVARYELAAPECPLRLDVLEGGVLVTPTAGNLCTFTAADCAVTPKGLWGPGAANLMPRAQEFDTARGVADKAVRDNYKVMSQRLRGPDLRPVVQEQAAFSSDREEVCRTYAREGAHGFCHLRFTEARALALAVRLGANTATPTASATPRPRRKPAVDGLNPDAADQGPTTIIEQ